METPRTPGTRGFVSGGEKNVLKRRRNVAATKEWPRSPSTVLGTVFEWTRERPRVSRSPFSSPAPDPGGGSRSHRKEAVVSRVSVRSAVFEGEQRRPRQHVTDRPSYVKAAVEWYDVSGGKVPRGHGTAAGVEVGAAWVKCVIHVHCWAHRTIGVVPPKLASLRPRQTKPRLRGCKDYCVFRKGDRSQWFAVRGDVRVAKTSVVWRGRVEPTGLCLGPRLGVMQFHQVHYLMVDWKEVMCSRCLDYEKAYTVLVKRALLLVFKATLNLSLRSVKRSCWWEKATRRFLSLRGLSSPPGCRAEPRDPPNLSQSERHFRPKEKKSSDAALRCFFSLLRRLKGVRWFSPTVTLNPPTPAARAAWGRSTLPSCSATEWGDGSSSQQAPGAPRRGLTFIAQQMLPNRPVLTNAHGGRGCGLSHHREGADGARRLREPVFPSSDQAAVLGLDPSSADPTARSPGTTVCPNETAAEPGGQVRGSRTVSVLRPCVPPFGRSRALFWTPARLPCAPEAEV